jgi:hypothetical protein
MSQVIDPLPAYEIVLASQDPFDMLAIRAFNSQTTGPAPNTKFPESASS